MNKRALPLVVLGAMVVVSSIGAAPAPSPSPTPTLVDAWLGVTLGEDSHAVRAQLGKPLEIAPTSIGDVWRYNFDSGNVTLELMLTQDQVVNIAARVKDGKHSALADPFGAALGMSPTALQSVRGTPIATYDDGARLAYGQSAGVRWFYSIDNGAVSAIEVSKPLPPPPAAHLTADTQHDGTSSDRAIVVEATSQGDVAAAETDYLHSLACDAGGNWVVTSQQLIVANGRYFDRFHVACSASSATRDFFFDITAAYNK